MNQPDYIFKVIAIGNNSVGKTSVLNSFVTKRPTTFMEIPTIGIDLHATDVIVRDKKIRLHFWDTAGQEHFRSIIQSFYRGCAGAILVFDVTSWKSFNHLSYWVKEIRRDNPIIPLIMLGNKIDLEDNRVVAKGTAQQFAVENKMAYYEVTARDFSTIGPPMLDLIKNIYDKYIENPSEYLGVRKYNFSNKPKNESKCCSIF